MHAQREGEFPSMVQIVLNEMPEDPLACIGLNFSIIVGILNKSRQIGDSPVGKRILNDLPRGLQAIDQFGSGKGRLIRSSMQVRKRDHLLLISSSQCKIKPARPRPNDMGSVFTNRTEMWRRTQR